MDEIEYALIAFNSVKIFQLELSRSKACSRVASYNLRQGGPLIFTPHISFLFLFYPGKKRKKINGIKKGRRLFDVLAGLRFESQGPMLIKLD